ncbi:MAG TPA: hypothetical protein VHD32_10975 [Candidatus Didemnitutus sp.]|nr:hypothetical protein [Candidatus Didemnitutus sp.]
METEKLIWHAYLRLFQGADQWHNRRFPPSFEARVGDERVDFSCRDWSMSCLRAETLQDRFQGRCHVLLSGPSVRRIARPALLGNAFLIGVNGSPQILDESGMGLDLYVVDDLHFVRNRTDDYLRFANRATYTLVNHGIVAELRALGLSLPNGVIVETINTPFRRARPPENDAVVFSRRFGDGLKPYGTVAYIALQAAYALGFRQVNLFGMDLNSAGRYYAENRPEPSNLLREYEHFILRPFRSVGAMVAAGEWSVVNCSPESRLPDSVLPKADPNEVLAASALMPLTPAVELVGRTSVSAA